MVKRAASLTAALKAVDAWVSPDALDEVWQRHLFESAFQADMLGRLEVVGPEAGVVDLAPPAAQYMFANLPFEEAVRFFKSKRAMTPRAFYKLQGSYRQRAFTAKLLRNDKLRKHCKLRIERALEQGISQGEFVRDFEKLHDAMGVTRPARHYLNTVWSTNVHSAYNAGHLQQSRQPYMLKARPYREYITVGDRRVRPEHAAMHGEVWAADDPVWNRIHPPNGFACRCTAVTMSESEAKAEGVEVRPRGFVPKGAEVAEGFEAPPMAVLDTCWPAYEKRWIALERQSWT